MRSLLSTLPLVFIAATFLVTVRAQPAKKDIPSAGPTDPRLAPLDNMMIRFLQAHPKVPGATIAVAREGKIVYDRGFGYADAKTPMTPDARMRIASISKPLTAVAILQLIERGLLRLDTKVFDLLCLEEPKKKFDGRWRQVTIQHLLQHTGGWDRDKSFDPMFHNAEICSTLKIASPARQRDIIRYMVGQRFDFDPGTRYAYSNFGYCLLGRVIEKVSGQTYEEYVRRAVLLPVGARNTVLGKSLWEERHPKEVTYDCGGQKVTAILGPNLGKPVLVPYGAWSQEALDSHGGWVATAADLVRFAVAFNHLDNSPLLKATSIETMFARPPGPVGQKKDGTPLREYYGCGWMVRAYGNNVWDTWHAGLLDGTSTILVRRGAGSMTWAVLFNCSAVSANRDAVDVIDPLVHDAVDAIKNWP